MLFADADGATDINSLDKVFNDLKGIEKNGLGCAIGSRYDEESNAEVFLLALFF